MASINFQRSLAIIWTAVVIASGIGAVNPTVWAIENGPSLAAFLWLFFTRKSRPLSRAGYLCCSAFLVLHEIGAHYTYLRVPLGYWIQPVFGLVRNDYDRIVHFVFGLLVTFPAWESFRRNIRGSLLPLYLLSFALIMWLSALYEIAEAYVLLAAPGAGAVFLATQGDGFDSQNDMACAMLGSLLCLLGIAITRRRGAG